MHTCALLRLENSMNVNGILFSWRISFNIYVIYIIFVELFSPLIYLYILIF